MEKTLYIVKWMASDCIGGANGYQVFTNLKHAKQYAFDSIKEFKESKVLIENLYKHTNIEKFKDNIDISQKENDFNNDKIIIIHYKSSKKLYNIDLPFKTDLCIQISKLLINPNAISVKGTFEDNIYWDSQYAIN